MRITVNHYTNIRNGLPSVIKGIDSDDTCLLAARNFIEMPLNEGRTVA